MKRDTTLRVAENDTALDNLDAYRRIELAHPEICRRLAITLTAPSLELADTMLSLLEEHLVDRVPAFSAVRPDHRVCDGQAQTGAANCP